MTLPAETHRAAATDHRAFEAARRMAVLARVRIVTTLALGPLLLAAVLNCYAFRDHQLRDHLATLALQGLCMGTVLALTRVRGVDRFARPLAVGLAVTIASIQFWAIAISGSDADLMLSAVLAIMLVPSLTFPWGLGPQAVVTCYAAAGYLSIVPWHQLDEARMGNLLIGTLLGGGVSVGAAAVLDRQRRATFVERNQVAALAHQRELLLNVGRRLNSTMDMDALVILVARLSQQMLDCDFATVTLNDPVANGYDMVAVARGSADVMRRRFSGESHLPALAEMLNDRGLVEVPGDLEIAALGGLDHRFGVTRSLLVGIHRDGHRLGVISFNQRSAAVAFTAQQKALAEGIAHQAAIALANARLVDDLQRASRVKSEFLSTMSHELRTPLNVILGYAEIGRDPAIDPAVHPDYFARIEAAGRDLFDLIEGTLAIGRLEANRDTLEITRVPLPELWAGLHDVCARFPRAPEVALEWTSRTPAPDITTDARKLEVVVRNLVGNALKFTVSGHVRVQATAVDGALVISVADTGIGIRPEDQGRIFEMFSQGDSSDSRRFGGTGLGLYIVRQYVERLGGSVKLESQPGQGSTFTVTLPGAVDRSARAA